MGEIYEQLEYTPYGELWVEHLETTIETTPFRFTGKERDSETGLYYFGARYLNSQTSMWLSADPAMGEYIPQAPINDEAKKHNQNLPGLGGVFNYVNLHVYHYAGNNPVKYTDPDGRDSGIAIDDNGAAGQGHVGIYVKGDNDDYYFYEFTGISDDANISIDNKNGIPSDAKAYTNHVDKYGYLVLVLSNNENSFPGPGLSDIAGFPKNAGVLQRHFADKNDLLAFLGTAGYDRALDFNTTPEQDALIRSSAISIGKKMGHYNLTTNNCADYALKVLSIPGSGITSSNKMRPKNLYSHLSKRNRDLIKTEYVWQ
jgi:RHS repeat-associated protein